VADQLGNVNANYYWC